jgi:hypothetical protein
VDLDEQRAAHEPHRRPSLGVANRNDTNENSLFFFLSISFLMRGLCCDYMDCICGQWRLAPHAVCPLTPNGTRTVDDRLAVCDGDLDPGCDVSRERLLSPESARAPGPPTFGPRSRLGRRCLGALRVVAGRRSRHRHRHGAPHVRGPTRSTVRQLARYALATSLFGFIYTLL